MMPRTSFPSILVLPGITFLNLLPASTASLTPGGSNFKTMGKVRVVLLVEVVVVVVVVV